MQFASFDLADPVFEVFGRRFSFQLVTLENLHGMDAARTRIEARGEGLCIRCDGLTWAGGQQRAAGRFEAVIERSGPERLRAVLRAEAPAPIRCVKWLLRDLDPELAVRRSDGGETPVGPFGALLEYPTRLAVPLVRFRAGREGLAFRAEDPRVRPKRFAASQERVGPLAGRGVVEWIHEEEATRFAATLEAPDLWLAAGRAAEQAEAEQLAFAERAFGLVPFEARGDVPDWARRIRLVATLHGMHFTGRVFLPYREMLRVLRFLAERIPGHAILAYLPGWEGRYYWQYGDYRPEPRLGGSAEFAHLADGARALGVHLMPMFGANCANLRLPALADTPGELHLASATGNRFHGNQPDWDLARAHDTGWQAWLNPGQRAWRERLAEQIEAVLAGFGLDAVFLDTVHAFTNDPHAPVFDGLRELVARLRAHTPGLLLAGEADYDALLGLLPLFQHPWWERPAPWTGRYVRRFAHLCEGEPRGLTGVHEFGVWTPSVETAGAGRIPTLAFQDGTLEACRTEIEAALAALAKDSL
jgi:hypothetical protein